MRQQSVPGDVIRLDSVTKAYQAGAPPALADVSMGVAAGEVVAIMGPSGSGKSTLLNLIAGLDRPTAGTVAVAGRRIDTLGESALARFRARHVGIVFQFFNLLDDLTVEDSAGHRGRRGFPADQLGRPCPPRRGAACRMTRHRRRRLSRYRSGAVSHYTVQGTKANCTV